jgi:hypothetical protein
MIQKLFLIILTCYLLVGTAYSPKQYDPCEVYGAIYIEENPRRAHFKVFEESSESFADILVFEQDNKLYADGQGKWFFTKNRDFADFFVYFETERGLADFSVYYTEFESFAGCNR